MAGQMKLVVTLTGRRSLAAICSELEAAGFKIEQTLDSIGVLTGTADQQAIGKLRDVDGVESVEQEQEIDIGPPDGPSW